MKNAPCWAPRRAASARYMIRRLTPSQVALALHHPGEARQVRVQPVLLRVASVVSRRLAIIWLMLSLSSATSPCASTVIYRVRSPCVTAVETSAIARTCVVSVAGELVHVVGEARQTPDTPSTCAWPPSLPSVPDLARDARHLGGERAQLVDHGVDRLLELEHLAADVDRDLLLRSPLATAVVTSAMLRTCVVRFDGRPFTESVRSFHVPLTPAPSPGRRGCPRCRPRARRASPRRRTTRAGRPSC